MALILSPTITFNNTFGPALCVSAPKLLKDSLSGATPNETLSYMNFTPAQAWLSTRLCDKACAMKHSLCLDEMWEQNKTNLIAYEG